MNSLSLSLMVMTAVVIILILWLKGWRFMYEGNAAIDEYEYGSWWSTDDTIIKLVSFRMYVVLGLSIGRRNKARWGGYEGGTICLIVFHRQIGIWRDPYRSLNSHDYLADYFNGERKLPLVAFILGKGRDG